MATDKDTTELMIHTGELVDDLAVEVGEGRSIGSIDVALQAVAGMACEALVYEAQGKARLTARGHFALAYSEGGMVEGMPEFEHDEDALMIECTVSVTDTKRGNTVIRCGDVPTHKNGQRDPFAKRKAHTIALRRCYDGLFAAAAATVATFVNEQKKQNSVLYVMPDGTTRLGGELQQARGELPIGKEAATILMAEVRKLESEHSIKDDYLQTGLREMIHGRHGCFLHDAPASAASDAQQWIDNQRGVLEARNTASASEPADQQAPPVAAPPATPHAEELPATESPSTSQEISDEWDRLEIGVEERQTIVRLALKATGEGTYGNDASPELVEAVWAETERFLSQTTQPTTDPAQDAGTGQEDENVFADE